MRPRITDDYIGKYVYLRIGFGKGLIGRIESNATGVGVSPYVHITKTGMRTGVAYQEHVVLIDSEEGL